MIDGDADNSRVPDDQIADVRRIWKRINSVFCISWCTSIFYFKCTDQCVFLHMHRLATSSLTIPAYACSYPVAFKCMAQATQLLPPFPLFTFIQTGCTGHRLTAFTVLLCHVSQLIKQTVHSHWTTYVDASCIHVHTPGTVLSWTCLVLSSCLMCLRWSNRQFTATEQHTSMPVAYMYINPVQSWVGHALYCPPVSCVSVDQTDSSQPLNNIHRCQLHTCT